MKLKSEAYLKQVNRWPNTGRHILAQFDSESVVVYQAYRPEIGLYAARHQRFGGDFSFNRMSWIKPNFLWMMYRSGWGSKEGQQVTLAIRLRRAAFEKALSLAVHSSYQKEVYGTEQNWKARLIESPVRLQWDPDHGPNGEKQDRRAIQLGLAGVALQNYCNDWILDIEDISEFVAEQRERVNNNDLASLVTPLESIYLVSDSSLVMEIGVDEPCNK